MSGDNIWNQYVYFTDYFHNFDCNRSQVSHKWKELASDNELWQLKCRERRVGEITCKLFLLFLLVLGKSYVS